MVVLLCRIPSPQREYAWARLLPFRKHLGAVTTVTPVQIVLSGSGDLPTSSLIRRRDGFQWPDASEIIFMYHVPDCHKKEAAIAPLKFDRSGLPVIRFQTVSER